MPRRAAASSPPDRCRRHPRVQARAAGHQQGDDRRQEVHRREIVYDALEIALQAHQQGAVEALEDSIKSLTPVLEVRSRRVGGATYQVPVEVPPRRARTLAVRWLIEFSRRRREKTMAERLAGELLDAQSEQGGAFKRKDDIYRMAQANKAFAHYRW